MHAFLVSESPDIPESADTLHLHPENSIGIAEIRQVSVFLSRKPVSLPVNTVIVHDAHLLTIPAQNAFLKTLEEPPKNSVIYLVTPQPELLLPTILSRVQVVADNHKVEIDPEKLKKSAGLIRQLLDSSGEGECLSVIQNQGFTRQTALEFLDHLEHLLHQEVNSLKPSLKLKEATVEKLYRLVSGTRTLLKANVNLTLALGHFAIHLKSPLSD